MHNLFSSSFTGLGPDVMEQILLRIPCPGSEMAGSEMVQAAQADVLARKIKAP